MVLSELFGYCGGGGIRTHEAKMALVFKTSAIDRYATPPDFHIISFYHRLLTTILLSKTYSLWMIDKRDIINLSCKMLQLQAKLPLAPEY